MKSNKMIAYKPRIADRVDVDALRYLADKEGLKFNTYLCRVFKEHLALRGIYADTKGNIILKNRTNKNAKCKHENVYKPTSQGGSVCDDCGRYLTT